MCLPTSSMETRSVRLPAMCNRNFRTGSGIVIKNWVYRHAPLALPCPDARWSTTPWEQRGRRAFSFVLSLFFLHRSWKSRGLNRWRQRDAILSSAAYGLSALPRYQCCGFRCTNLLADCGCTTESAVTHRSTSEIYVWNILTACMYQEWKNVRPEWECVWEPLEFHLDRYRKCPPYRKSLQWDLLTCPWTTCTSKISL